MLYQVSYYRRCARLFRAVTGVADTGSVATSLGKVSKGTSSGAPWWL